VGGLVRGTCSGLLTAVELNQSARRASREVSGAVGARNWNVAHHAVRSTRGGGRMESGDGNPVPPAKWCSV
jgi:ribosomal protein L16/L10AE